MHGRKKSDQPRSQVELTAVQQKAEKLSKIIHSVLECKKSRDYSVKSLDLTTQVLRGNPDFYSVWNFRKEILISMVDGLSNISTAAGDRIFDHGVREREMKLSEDCIRKNPKSYGAWHHRQWILERFQTDYNTELELCSLFLREDQRNFHCWCYRRLAVQIGNISASKEFEYSTDKIDENFSNYSAFHHRSVFIRLLGIPVAEVAESEFSLIENAIYTEPDDQSSWWYHQFLLTWMLEQHQQGEEKGEEKGEKVSTDLDKTWFYSVLDQQINAMRGLLEIETTSKWAMSSLSMMLEIALKLLSKTPSINSIQNPDKDYTSEEIIKKLNQQRQDLLITLCEVDPNHINRYKYLLRREYGATNFNNSSS